MFCGRARHPAAIVALGLVAGALSGCGSMIADSHTDPTTLQRSDYVATMLQNSAASGPETQSGIMSVIAGYGGGYVTDAKLTGSGPTEVLTLTVVLGGGSVRNSMQSETDFGPSGIACFTYTVAYYDYNDTKSHASCPASLTTATARATAKRQIDEQVASERYQGGFASIPTSPAAAEQAIGLGKPANASATAGVTAANFAVGTDSMQHKPDAALALPQSGGGCIFVIYRWIQSSQIRPSASTADARTIRAWAAPTDAPCTGAAALSAGAFLTNDSYAGG